MNTQYKISKWSTCVPSKCTDNKFHNTLDVPFRKLTLSDNKGPFVSVPTAYASEGAGDAKGQQSNPIIGKLINGHSSI